MYSALQGGCDPAIVAIIAAFFIGFAGIPGLFLKAPGPGQLIATVTTILAALAGIPSSLALLFAPATTTFILPWALPFGPFSRPRITYLSPYSPPSSNSASNGNNWVRKSFSTPGS